MGNHLVGKMFIAGLSTYSDEDIDDLTQEKALDIIDKIGKVVIQNTSLDAEFDNHLEPNQPLGRVIIKAFLPEKYNEWKNKPFIDDEIDDEWYNKVYKQFTNRFGFY